jgi:hypothetical protein
LQRIKAAKRGHSITKISQEHDVNFFLPDKRNFIKPKKDEKKKEDNNNSTGITKKSPLRKSSSIKFNEGTER